MMRFLLYQEMWRRYGLRSPEVEGMPTWLIRAFLAGAE